MNSALASTLLVALLPAAPPAYKLQHAPTKEIEAVLSQEFHLPQGRPTEWVLAGPIPPDLPRQRKTSAVLDVVGHKAERGEPHKSLVIVTAPGVPTIKVELKIRATLYSTKLVAVEPGEKRPENPPLPAEERRLWIGEDHKEIEAKGFQEWLSQHKLRREAKESELEFAMRAFQFIATHFKYHYEENMNRSAAAVARAGQSDCGGIANLYVSVLRASKIPARTMPGRWAASFKKEDKVGGLPFFQTHVKTEFHADGIGWIPVDPTGGVGQGQKVDDFYFGNDHGDFLVFSLPSPHVFENKAVGKQTVSGTQGVEYFLAGKGKFDNVKESDVDWKVESKSLVPEKKK